MKNRMWRYFTFQNIRRYMEALPALMDSYNKVYDRNIGTAPKRRDTDQCSRDLASIVLEGFCETQHTGSIQVQSG